MALETMKGVNEINGEKVIHMYKNLDHWTIFVDHDKNEISFRIQNGPIKEVGKNGCQVEDMIAVAKHIVEQLNAKFPCRENAMIITKLDEAIMWSKKRTADRQARNVEGKSEA